MTEAEIEAELVRIVGWFDGIHENDIESILMTIAALEAEREVKYKNTSTHGERVFFTELAKSFMEPCLKRLWELRRFSREDMAAILKCDANRLAHYYQKAIWNITTKPRWPNQKFCVDANGKIAIAGKEQQAKGTGQ